MLTKRYDYSSVAVGDFVPHRTETQLPGDAPIVIEIGPRSPAIILNCRLIKRDVPKLRFHRQNDSSGGKLTRNVALVLDPEPLRGRMECRGPEIRNYRIGVKGGIEMFSRRCETKHSVRGTVIFLLLLSASVTVFAQDAGFRGFAWGTPRAAIIEAEGEPDTEHTTDAGTELTYDSVLVAGHEAGLSFVIGPDGHLVLGGYEFTARYVVSFEDEYTRDFDDIDLKLSGIYGGPSVREDVWRANKRGTRGDSAIRSRALVFFSGWDAGDTTIIHVCRLAESGVEHMLFYMPEGKSSAAEALSRMTTSGL